jgi:large conductance mechanosensitive channel
MLPEF